MAFIIYRIAWGREQKTFLPSASPAPCQLGISLSLSLSSQIALAIANKDDVHFSAANDLNKRKNS